VQPALDDGLLLPDMRPLQRQRRPLRHPLIIPVLRHPARLTVHLRPTSRLRAVQSALDDPRQLLRYVLRALRRRQPRRVIHPCHLPVHRQPAERAIHMQAAGRLRAVQPALDGRILRPELRPLQSAPAAVQRRAADPPVLLRPAEGLRAVQRVLDDSEQLLRAGALPMIRLWPCMASLPPTGLRLLGPRVADYSIIGNHTGRTLSARRAVPPASCLFCMSCHACFHGPCRTPPGCMCTSVLQVMVAAPIVARSAAPQAVLCSMT